MSNDIIPNNQQASLEVYDRISNPMEAIKSLGLAIFKSGMFGCDRPEQGEVLAMQCLAERKSPLELMRTYHFVEGRLAMKADALLAKFLQSGGRVEWRERTDKRVVAIFSRPPQAGVEIVADIDEHVKNGNAISSKTGKLKDNWSKWPRRMLTARAISEGVRLISPDCCFGVGVEDEVGHQRARQTINLDLGDIIPEGKEDMANALFIEMGFLKQGQELSDLSAAAVRAIRMQADAINKMLYSGPVGDKTSIHNEKNP